MIGKVSGTYAVRSLLRQPRRTVLSVIGAGVGCALSLFASSWVRGEVELTVRAASGSGVGHLRVVPEQWPERRENTMRLVDWEDALASVRSLEGVRNICIRARVNGLLAFGTRTSGVELTGVDPEAEPAGNRIVSKARIEGRYLEPGDTGKVVIGKVLARRLDVELGDDLYATMAGRDEIVSAMLEIVGIMETGGRELDASICHVSWRDVERLTGYEGPGEITILLDDYRKIDERQAELAAKLGKGSVVITWRETTPYLAANLEGDKRFFRILLGIIIIVVVLGIASAQLTAVLERRREFAILTAIGMKGRQLLAIMVLEALAVAAAGTAVALALGGSGALWLARSGVSFAAIMGTDDLSIGEVMLEPYMYGDFGGWLVWQAIAICVTATVLASLYPAWLITRIDPAEALRTA